MKKYIFKRLLSSLLVLLGVVTITFFISRVIPSNPATKWAGTRATEEQLAAAREELGLDDPLPVQYINYLKDLLHGDLGINYSTRQPVSLELATYVPATVELVLLAFVLAIIILFVMGMENPVAFKLVILLTSVWWLVFSTPFLKNVHQVHYVEAKRGLLRSTFRNLWATAKDIFTHKRVFLFIIAYFFYIDGVNTIISVSTSYGTTLGLDTVGMILALLVTQVVAMPFSILFGRLAGKVGSINLLCGAVGIYFVITVVGFFMGFNIEQNPGSESALALSQGLFWCMAFLVGTVQGGIQALSRSYFGKLVPADRSNEYFGFFDIFGKFAAVIGPLLVGLFTQFTGRDSIGVISLAILFLIGEAILLAGRKRLFGEEKQG